MEWIKCSERLPLHHQKVIFYVKQRDECFCGFFEEFSEHRRIDSHARNIFYENLDNWWFEDEDIIWWMPLPLPPKD